MMVAKYSRNPVVKNYISKMALRQKPIDETKWYHINTEVLPPYLQDKFEASSLDAGTEEFIENCYEKSDWVFTQIFHNVCRMFLGFFMSMTTVNGLLNRGSMFVFSENRFRSFLNVTKEWKAESLLDLGAGDGKVTESILHHFDNIYATEQSPTMQWRLKEKGFEVLEIDRWHKDRKYSVITALNLLDRINRPVTLLQQLRSAMKQDDSYIVLAIVLPYNPCYETGVSFEDPTEKLPIRGRSIEEQIKSLHDDVFLPNGFEVIKFTRLPYLCEGDIHHDYFVLTDILFLLKRSDIDGTGISESYCYTKPNI